MIGRTPEEQCRANVLAWLAYVGAESGPMNWHCATDRVFLPRSEFRESRMAALVAEGKLEKRGAANHGESVVIAYRECVPRCAAQVVIHADEIEIDFDEWQPWDVRGGVMHAWECLRNRIWRRKTDPFVIARKLKERGIYVAV